MNPGKYRHPITFLKRSSGQDDYGEPTDTWETFAEAWAAADSLLGNEFFFAMSVESKVEMKFNSRYVAGVTDDMRIRYGNEVYEILSAIDVKSLHKELLCYCRKVTE
jgi:SPP1 family predicted phage head-tail adaptor